MGIVINDNDPLSIEIGNYYRERRDIPAANVVHLHFPTKNDALSPGVFAVQKRILDESLPARVQALALTWTKPYRVGCMSITSAFAFGFHERYCAKGCVMTARSPYYDSDSHAPYTDFHIRPTMMLAARNFQAATALIERGIASDASLPKGAAYLMDTSDKARDTRKIFYATACRAFGSELPVHIVHADVLKNKRNVMFYFTGLVSVPDIDTNRFMPGAVADHLTSFGGRLVGKNSQMSALRWLEAGATGSYGTVVEPCAFTQKFPNPAVMMKYYLAGETLIEAYWKSVMMPGQGVFIGEPLARPYGAYRVHRQGGHWYVYGTALQPGYYRVFAADSAHGPYRRIANALPVYPLTRELELPTPVRKFYRLQRLDFNIKQTLPTLGPHT